MTHPQPPQLASRSSASSRGDRLALVVLCLAQAMLVLDVTVVNVALPVMSRELGLPEGLAGWAVAAYAVTFGGLLLLGGRLADVFGTKRMLPAGLAVFTVASLAAGLASSAEWFLAARAVQGVGAALLSPAALAVLLHRFDGAARHRALAVWGAVGGGGAAVGVLLGGLLAGGPGWRWIFFINVPVGVLVAIAIVVFGVAVPVARRRERVDVAGALLATAGVGSLIAALSASTSDEGALAAGLAALGAALLAAFVAAERRVSQPLVRLELVRSRPVATGSLLMLVATGLLVGGLFMLSFELQVGSGWSPIETGLAFLPISVAIVAGAHVAGRAVGRVGARIVGSLALLVAAIGLGTTAAATSIVGAEFLAIAGMTVAALGLGAAFVCASTTALSGVDGTEAGAASGVLNSFHELGSAVGVAALGAIAATSIGVGFQLAAVVAVVAAVVTALAVASGVPRAGAHFVH
ncbi:MFS transporter [Agromyces ramosus]|uniref:EmrB/QacA subfamily drug resistance transporter n=1 Tax=Agromyces ramosus TaxID=33879 RepID=A0ABU0R6K0_9MICO|nr:MFS transporter [Agromyces ramosus]MDQ0893721.1 EmrB/QacA subfamily drug resistance transporter [Agromyces ramosus]